MRIFPFRLESDQSLIHITAFISREKHLLALDTGASNTVIDLASIIVAGYSVADALETVQLETGNGVVDAYVFVLKSFNALGVMKKDFQVCSYDFFGNNVYSDIHGVLGLDFFKNTDLNISFKRFEITVT
jgi:hypothetical protein